MAKIKTPSKESTKKSKTVSVFDKDVLQKAFRLMSTAKCMTETYEANSKVASKYVHAMHTST